MNVLILTARCGMGHYSAAEAIKEELINKNENINIKVVDIFDYLFPHFSHVIYGSFDFMVQKCSSIYNNLYQITSRKDTTHLIPFVLNKIRNLIQDGNIDLVISTFPACSRYVSIYKEINKTVKLYTFITDINPNLEWISKNTDLYCVASDETKDTLVKNGVNKNKIIITGIPVKSKFKMDESVCYSISCKKEILVMGGGLGLLPSINTTLKELSNDDSLHITVIAGKNERLKRKYKNQKNITILGFTDKVYKYMKTSDLIVTKSGGITLFEAIYSKIPLYIIKPFLDQEVANAKFIEKQKVGVVSWDKKSKIADQIKSLLNNNKKLNDMKNNMLGIQINLDKLPI